MRQQWRSASLTKRAGKRIGTEKVFIKHENLLNLNPKYTYRYMQYIEQFGFFTELPGNKNKFAAIVSLSQEW